MVKVKQLDLKKIELMTIQFDILQLIEVGKIQNELDFERALIADRKLRILSKENSNTKTV